MYNYVALIYTCWIDTHTITGLNFTSHRPFRAVTRLKRSWLLQRNTTLKRARYIIFLTAIFKHWVASATTALRSLVSRCFFLNVRPLCAISFAKVCTVQCKSNYFNLQICCGWFWKYMSSRYKIKEGRVPTSPVKVFEHFHVIESYNVHMDETLTK